jgi:PAS domain S-box-containing protein
VQRDRSERALRHEQERSHQILSSMKDGFLLMDVDFRVQQINTEGLRLDGRPLSALLGRTHWELWPGSESLPVGQAYKRAMRDRETVSLEQCYPHGGRDIWLDIQAFPFGKGLAVFYRDVSARKHADVMLREREEQLRLATEAADVGLWDVHPAAGTLFWPATVKAMFGIAADQPVSMDDFYAGLHPSDREHTAAAFADACNPELRSLYDVEFRTVGKEDQKIRWVAAKGRAIFDDAGRCIRVIGTAIDITQRKASEEALRNSEKRLRESDRKKDEFLAMLAHELRNPLAPINAAADLLALTNSGDERVKKATSTISRQVKHMTSLVDDLLDVSRVTRGLVALERSGLDAKQIVSDAIEQSRPMLEGRHHRFAVHIPSEPAYVLGDHKRLVQVLTNVLNNAAKYTPEGGSIVLRMEVDAAAVRLCVKDNGIGMRAEVVEQAFDMFTQAERTSDRTQGGLGIGLALVKSLVELHHGTVTAHSEGPGQGSEFFITLPRLDPPDLVSSPAECPVHLSNNERLRLLIVDDNRDAAQMLSMYLEAAGYDTIVQHDAQSALQRACVDGPHACLLDIGLPGMDGNQMAQQLKAHPATKRSLLIAITGYGHEHNRQKSAEAGFDHYLVKPVNMDQLQRILAEAAQQAAPPRSASALARPDVA